MRGGVDGFWRLRERRDGSAFLEPFVRRLQGISLHEQNGAAYVASTRTYFQKVLTMLGRMSVAFQFEARGMNRSATWTSLIEALKLGEYLS